MTRFLLVAVTGAALALTVARLFFGIDLTDESQYVAQALGPAIGGAAFITDRLFQQSASLLTTPVIWIYTKLVGSTAGLVLFYRFLYLASGLLTSTVLYQSLRKKLSPPEALVLAILPLVYIPFSIPSFSYNTAGIHFTIMTLALWRRQDRWIKHLAPWTATLAVFSYPPLVIAFVCFFLLEFRKKANRRAIAIGVSTALILMALLGLWILSLGVDELKRNFELARAVSLLTTEAKWNLSLNYLTQLFPGPIYWVALLLIILYFYRTKRPFEFVAFPIFAIFYLTLAQYLLLEINFGFFLYSLLVTVILILWRWLQFHERWFWSSEFLAGLVAGLAMGVTSGNGIINAALGFSIAVIFLLELVAIHRRRFPWVAWLSVVTVCCFASWSFFYREGKFSELTEQMKSGPYLGLVTNPAKAAFLRSLEQDINSLPGTARSLFVYDSLPAGYLFSLRTPITFMYYMHPTFLTPTLRPQLVEFFLSQGARPDVVIETYRVPVTSTNQMIPQDPSQNLYRDPFWGFFRNSKDYRLFIQRSDYSIYLRSYL